MAPSWSAPTASAELKWRSPRRPSAKANQVRTLAPRNPLRSDQRVRPVAHHENNDTRRVEGPQFAFAEDDQDINRPMRSVLVTDRDSRPAVAQTGWRDSQGEQVTPITNAAPKVAQRRVDSQVEDPFEELEIRRNQAPPRPFPTPEYAGRAQASDNGGDDPFESSGQARNFSISQDANGTLQNGRRNSMAELREEAAETCVEAIKILDASKLSGIDLDIHIDGTLGEDVPYQCTTLSDREYRPRAWGPITYMWKASALCHKPLYLEDVHLERYGHSWGWHLQPLASAAHFFVTVPILPYKMGLKVPNECEYVLGYYRPGNCAPYLIEPLGFTKRAALFEAGAIVGTAAIVP